MVIALSLSRYVDRMAIPAATYRRGMVGRALPRVGVPVAVTGGGRTGRVVVEGSTRSTGGAVMGGRSTVGIRFAGLMLLALLGMTAGGVLGRLPALADYSPVPVVPVVEWAVGADR